MDVLLGAEKRRATSREFGLDQAVFRETSASDQMGKSMSSRAAERWRQQERAQAPDRTQPSLVSYVHISCAWAN